MNTKNTKKRLVASLLAMAMCFTMLIGSTFAWFTDAASVTGNKIQAGKLDIELWEQVWPDAFDKEGMTEVNITTSTTPIFEYANWEPGYLDFTNITVKNVGTLAAKIKATLVPVGEVGELAEVIDVYVSKIPFAKNYENGEYSIRDYLDGKIGNTGNPWVDNFLGATYKGHLTKVGTLKDVLEKGLTLVKDETVLPGDDQEPFLIGIALKMQETAGNEYQEREAGAFDIRIDATQVPYEVDAYDDQYDAKAPYAVYDKTSLDAAFKDETVEEVYVIGGTYTETVEVPSGKSLVSSNGIFDTSDDNGYSSALDVKSGANLTLNGGTYAAAGMQVINAQSSASSVEINGGSYEGNVAVWNCGTCKVTINDGIFNTWALAVTDNNNVPIIVNGGTFNLGKGGIDAATGCNIIINGGTFNVDPTDWLGEGHTVTEANGIWTVK